MYKTNYHLENWFNFLSLKINQLFQQGISSGEWIYKQKRKEFQFFLVSLGRLCPGTNSSAIKLADISKNFHFILLKICLFSILIVPCMHHNCKLKIEHEKFKFQVLNDIEM